MKFLFTTSIPSVYFFLSMSAGGIVEKQVVVCSGCTLSDPVDSNPKAESWKYKPFLPPSAAPFLKLIQEKIKISHWNNRKWAGLRKQSVNKKAFSLIARKRSVGCTGGVMVEGVRAADEWVQEAVVSDILDQR